MKRFAIALAGVIAMLLGTSSVAGADYGAITAVADTSVCGQVTFTFGNTTPHTYSADWRFPDDAGTADEVSGLTVKEGPLAGEDFGLRYNAVAVPPGGSTHLKVFQEDAPRTTVEYSVRRGPEQNVLVGWMSVEVRTNCLPDRQEGDKCRKGGQNGTFQLVDGKLKCVVTVIPTTTTNPTTTTDATETTQPSETAEETPSSAPESSVKTSTKYIWPVRNQDKDKESDYAIGEVGSGLAYTGMPVIWWYIILGVILVSGGIGLIWVKRPKRTPTVQDAVDSGEAGPGDDEFSHRREH